MVRLGGASSSFDEELYDYYRNLVGRPRAEVHKAGNRASVERLLFRLGRRVRGRNLLDVGCGAGQLVDVAMSLGWSARGIDLAPGAIELCRSLGLPCSQQDFFDEALPRSRFDVIVMSELLEHVSSPGSFVRRAAALLRPGGLLYFTTPNYASLSRKLLGAEWRAIHPEHLVYLEPETVARIVARSGLALESLETRNFEPGPAVQHLLRRVTPDRGSAAHVAPLSGSSARARTQDLRQRLNQSPYLRVAVSALNRGFTAFGAGDTLVAICRKDG